MPTLATLSDSSICRHPDHEPRFSHTPGLKSHVCPGCNQRVVMRIPEYRACSWCGARGKDVASLNLGPGFGNWAGEYGFDTRSCFVLFVRSAFIDPEVASSAGGGRRRPSPALDGASGASRSGSRPSETDASGSPATGASCGAEAPTLERQPAQDSHSWAGADGVGVTTPNGA